MNKGIILIELKAIYFVLVELKAIYFIREQAQIEFVIDCPIELTIGKNIKAFMIEIAT